MKHEPVLTFTERYSNSLYDIIEGCAGFRPETTPSLTYEEPLNKPWDEILGHCVSFRPDELRVIQATHSNHPRTQTYNDKRDYSIDLLDGKAHLKVKNLRLSKYRFNHEPIFHYVFGLGKTMGLWIRQGNT